MNRDAINTRGDFSQHVLRPTHDDSGSAQPAAADAVVVDLRARATGASFAHFPEVVFGTVQREDGLEEGIIQEDISRVNVTFAACELVLRRS